MNVGDVPNRFGTDLMRYWKIWRPNAYDALEDPQSFFYDLGEEHEGLVRAKVAEHADRYPDVFDPEHDRRGVEEELEWMLRRGRHEEDFWVERMVDEVYRDPRGKWLDSEGLPKDPVHPWWAMVDDWEVTASELRVALLDWLDTVPRVPETQSVGTPVPAEAICSAAWGECSVDILREDECGSVIRTEETVVNSPGRFGADATSIFDVLRWADRLGLPWSTEGTLSLAARALALPSLTSDGSAASPGLLAELRHDVGALEAETQYVVVGSQPKVIDYSAVAWTTLRDQPRIRGATKPLLLIDIDGCLSPYTQRTHDRPQGLTPVLAGMGEVLVDRARAARLLDFEGRYDLVWATSWHETANSLGAELGWPSLPVIPVGSMKPGTEWDCWKIPDVLDYAGDRPFAWLDDQVTRHDADALLRDRDCLILRTAPRRGIEDHHLATLRSWVS